MAESLPAIAAGFYKTFICVVSLIIRRCGVRLKVRLTSHNCGSLACEHPVSSTGQAFEQYENRVKVEKIKRIRNIFNKQKYYMEGGMMKKENGRWNNHRYKPQSKLWKQFVISLWGIIPSAVRDCSTCKFKYTSFLKFESHNKNQH